MATFQLQIITPEAMAVQKTVSSVVLPAYDGEMGILAGHAPTVVRLGAGEAQYREPGSGPSSLYIEGGVAQIHNNTVTVLTLYSSAAAAINVPAAEKELAEVTARQPTTIVGREQRVADIVRLRKRLRVAERRRA